MRMGKGAGLLAAMMLLAGLLTGCKGFWDAPTSSSYTLSNSGNMTVAPGGTGTSTITVTPGSSFTGTVSLSCSITSTPTSATSPTTCSLSSSSLTFSSSTAQTSTLTASTSSSTTTGSYGITVTGTSGSATQTTTLCAQVTTGSDTCSSSSGNSSGVFYVLNQGTKQIATYSIASGKLKQIGNSYTLSAAPYSIAIAPNGKFLYVGTAAGIFLFNIASSGSITLANSSNVISQDIATTMQVDSTGQWLVEAGPNLAELLALHINTNTGVPTSSVEQNTLLPAATIQELTISPDNAHVFVAMGAAGTEDITFAAGNSTPFGTLANLKVVNNAGAAVSVAVDPQNRLIYIGETAAVSGSNSGGIRVIDYNTLTEVSGSPMASGGLAPYAITPMKAGNYVYVANRTVSGSSTGNIAAFSVTAGGSTATLTSLGSAVAAGVNPVAMTQESSGNYLLVVDFGGNPDLEAYTFSSGSLTSALSSATGTDPVQATAIAAAP